MRTTLLVIGILAVVALAVLMFGGESISSARHGASHYLFACPPESPEPYRVYGGTDCQ
jgi:hypothetical protein